MYKINREKIIRSIMISILNNKITYIYGVPGTGKSFALRECINTHFNNYKIKVINMTPKMFIQGISITLSSIPINEYNICIFDNFDNFFEQKEILKYINSLPNSNKIRFVIVSHNELKTMDHINSIVIDAFSEREVGQYLMMNLYYTEMLDIYHRKIFNETNGNPELVEKLTNILNQYTPYYVDDINIFYKPCIIDSSGRPIDKTNTSIKIIVSDVNDQLLYELSQNPKLLYNLSPYNFERVIARMFEKKGFTVKITPQTRDGGKDIFIAKSDLCSFLFYVECKKYAPNKPVGIDVIQRLYGVISAEKANGGFIATTSYFTKPAKDYIQEHQLEHQLTLQDYNTISDILKSLQYNTQ